MKTLIDIVDEARMEGFVLGVKTTVLVVIAVGLVCAVAFYLGGTR